MSRRPQKKLRPRTSARTASQTPPSYEDHAPDGPGTAADGMPALRDVIKRYDLAAKKSLSQNFILDLNLTRRIARIAAPLEGRTVVEVGPGPGGLTRALLHEGAARVIAVERDARCLPALSEIATHHDNKLTITEGDALDIDWRALVGPDVGKAIVAANLPYGIATLLLINWLEADPWPPWWARMVLMFQKEVAERIVAEPDTKAYGRLAVISQWRSTPRIAMTLKPEAFTPPPKVASAVVDITPRTTPQPACSVDALGKVTAAAFGQRRKMLRASLKTLVEQPEHILEPAGISPQLRAEHVTVREFAQLAYVYERSAVRQ